MPGIVGLITKMSRKRAERELSLMVDSIAHEPFYTKGMWMDDCLGVYVGWVARKNSFSDGMPVSNEAGDVILIFSGEEFPDPGIAQRLRNEGHALNGGGPSYLVHLAEESEEFPTGLNGHFHGLLINRKQRRAMLFNDRYGLERIYFHASPDAFYFGAEAKAILAVRPELRATDAVGLAEYIACGCALENRTLFKDISLLPPASAWTFSNGTNHSRRTYFEPRTWEEQEVLRPEAYYSNLREIFSRQLPLYFNSHEPIALSLTGGLDTRMIMAWQKASSNSLPCYTFSGFFRECRDVAIARQVARTCQQSHRVLMLGEQFLSKFPQLAERTVFLSDGASMVNHSADLYLNQVAREIAPVRITGNYGGEVLRRVRAFKPVWPVPTLFSSDLIPHFQRAGATYENLLTKHPLSFALFHQLPWHHYGLFALEQTQLTIRTPYLDNRLVQTIFRAPESACMGNDICWQIISDGNTALSRIPTDHGYRNQGSGIAGLTSRSLHKLTFKAEYAYDLGMPQIFAQLDRLLSRLRLERFFLGRHKFSHFRLWYREQLRNYVREVLLDPRTLSRPYLGRKVLESIVRDHLRGTANYTSEIHTVLTLELLHRLFLDA